MMIRDVIYYVCYALEAVKHEMKQQNWTGNLFWNVFALWRFPYTLHIAFCHYCIDHLVRFVFFVFSATLP